MKQVFSDWNVTTVDLSDQDASSNVHMDTKSMVMNSLHAIELEQGSPDSDHRFGQQKNSQAVFIQSDLPEKSLID